MCSHGSKGSAPPLLLGLKLRTFFPQAIFFTVDSNPWTI